MTRSLTLTDDFTHALDLLRDGHNLFLTGKAGTGKSTLVRHFLDTTDRRAITVAPTGIAALNVDGYTIHRLFSFPTGVDEHLARSSTYFPGRFSKAIRGLETLIVDEVSMVRADLFDAMVAALERFGPRPGEPFGGVQLVLVGDLYQLPPVVTDAEAQHIEERFGTPFFFSAHSFERDLFPVIELTTVFRQSGDNRLVDLLNHVRDGALLDDARAELNQRTSPAFEPDIDEFWLTLATTNRIVHARNRDMLSRLQSPKRTFNASVVGETDGFEYPAEKSLTLAEGAQVMLLNNDSRDRWVNGTLGRVTSIGTDGNEPVVEIQLRDGRVEEVRPYRWEITRPVVDGGRLRHEVLGAFTQLPLKLAWAITIHKSQGQTLDRVVVDLTGGTFANGQLYVALSRCTSWEGLILRRDVLPRDLKTDIRVRRFLNSASSSTDSLGDVYISALTVGRTGDRYRPRPVEIAVVTDDGDEATTVINPTSDLYTAQSDYGITTRDVQLAPVLTEAWAALSPLLAGRIPVGVHVDDLLGWIDFELKRNGTVEVMPLGRELSIEGLSVEEQARLRAPTALERARAIHAIATRSVSGVGDRHGTAFPGLPRGKGYLLRRTSGTGGTAHPTGFVVGGNLSAQDDPAEVLAEALRGSWGRVVDRDQTVIDRIRGVEEHFGVVVLPSGFELTDQVSISDVLTPGARVCFTGTVVSPVHGTLERSEIEQLAAEHGLEPVKTVTKSRTDVLVVAERGTQSGKAKNAAKWEKPVLAAEDFLNWITEKAR